MRSIIHMGVLLGLGAAILAGCSADGPRPGDMTGSVTAPSAAPEVSPNAAQHSSTSVMTHPSQGPVTVVPGAVATLVSNDAGVHLTLRTSGLGAGNPHTIWFVAVNDPAKCSARPCTPIDILVNHAAVKADVAFLTGNVVGENGTGSFGGSMRAGAIAGGWFGNGLTNPRGAEIHLIVQDHGPKIPGLVANQLSTVRGGCTDASLPGLYPAVAFADGIPGPNTCRLRQFAIFQQ